MELLCGHDGKGEGDAKPAEQQRSEGCRRAKPAAPGSARVSRAKTRPRGHPLGAAPSLACEAAPHRPKTGCIYSIFRIGVTSCALAKTVFVLKLDNFSSFGYIIVL
jgi:hypothetical protein